MTENRQVNERTPQAWTVRGGRAVRFDMYVRREQALAAVRGNGG